MNAKIFTLRGELESLVVGACSKYQNRDKSTVIKVDIKNLIRARKAMFWLSKNLFNFETTKRK